MRFPDPCLIVLVGPSGAGKSTWAAERFRGSEILSSDGLRSVVGEGEHDLEATAAAFQLLDLALEERLRRRLTTVVDTLGLDAPRRQGYLQRAREAGISAAVVGFDTPAEVCRARNRERRDPVPARALAGQLKSWRSVRDDLATEGWDDVHLVHQEDLSPVAVEEPVLAEARPRTEISFALHVSAFDGWETGEMALALAAIARRAEEVGFAAISVMDHVVQIPQVGREWDPILESYTTLAYLAAVTERAELGTLVTAATFRNPAHLAKIVATLDVLSGGRAFCGLGAGWFEKEHVAYGWELPDAAGRLDLLEDTIAILRLAWGAGGKSHDGKVASVSEAIGYPRPIQEHIPLLIGGQGERRTLRIVAEHGDACNLFGDAEAVRHKVAVLRHHCESVDRDPAEITVTHLAPAIVGRDRKDLERRVEAARPPRSSPAKFARTVNASTVEQHVDRLGALVDAGVERFFIPVPGLHSPEQLDPFAELIASMA